MTVRSTRLLRGLHFVAETAGFLPAPPFPTRKLRSPRQTPCEDVVRTAPLPFGEVNTVPEETRLSQEAHGTDRKVTLPPEIQPGPPNRLFPMPLWHSWLDASPQWQLARLRSVLSGRVAHQDRRWRIYQLPGWRLADPLAPLWHVYSCLGHCPADGTWLDLGAFLNSLPHHHLDVLPDEIRRANDPHRQVVAGLLAWLGVVQLDDWQAPARFRLTRVGAALLDTLSSDQPAQAENALPLTEPSAWRIAERQTEALVLAVPQDWNNMGVVKLSGHTGFTLKTGNSGRGHCLLGRQ